MSELKSTELHFKGPAQGFVLILSRSWSVHVLYYIFKALKNLNSFSLFIEEWAILVPLKQNILNLKCKNVDLNDTQSS